MKDGENDPRHVVPNAWNNIAKELQAAGHFEAACAAVRRAVLLAPGNSELLSNWGNMLRRCGKAGLARATLLQAINIDNSNANAFFNMAVLQATEYGEFDEAMGTYDHALTEMPNDGNVLFARACALLGAGRWREGFAAYECRLADRRYGWPFWDGRPLGKRHLFVHAEQGFGDTIMYHRFALELARREPEATITYMTPTVLARLLGASRAGVEIGQPSCHVPLMSLPHVLGIEDVDGAPYLVPRQKMYVASPPGTRTRIGLVWRAKSGAAGMKIDEAWHGRQKSIPLHLLLELVRIKGAQLYGLQVHCNDIAELGAQHLIDDLGGKIHDFCDLASYIDQMDVLVTADTATAHLGGALGVPTIVCCHNFAAWQWGNGDRSPWYDSVRIVRGPFAADRIASEVEACLTS